MTAARPKLRSFSISRKRQVILMLWKRNLIQREGLKDIKQAYLDIDEALELVPTEGTYAIPYTANAAGVLYNKDMFEEHGWEIPNSWGELQALCADIQSEGILPFYFGF